LDVCAEVNNVSQEQIIGQSRKLPIASARHMTAFFTKKYTDLTLESIGEKISNPPAKARNHATIINSIKKFNYYYESIASFRTAADAIEQKLMEKLEVLVGNKRLEYEFLEK
jgi:chromosomal replication initiator protein